PEGGDPDPRRGGGARLLLGAHGHLEGRVRLSHPHRLPRGPDGGDPRGDPGGVRAAPLGVLHVPRAGPVVPDLKLGGRRAPAPAPEPQTVEMGGYRRVAFLGGVYSNHLALREALRIARSRGVDAVFALGDFGAFGPHPDRTVEILRGE